MQNESLHCTVHYTARNNRPCLAKLFPLLHNVCGVGHRSRRTRAGPGHFSSPILCCVWAGSWWSRVIQPTFAPFSHHFWMMNVDCWCRCLLASRALRSADGFNGDQFPNVNSSPVTVRLLAVAWSVIQKYAFNVSSHFLEAAFWFFNDAKCAFTQMI